MGLLRLDHYALVTDRLNETIAFYQDILGLIHGPKLDGGFGEFLYFENSNQAVIHLLSTEKAKFVDNNKPAGFQVHGLPISECANTGSVDHIAFQSDLDYYNQLLEKLIARKIDYRLGKELEPKIFQVWFFDPNKIKVEVTYSNDQK